MCSTTSVFPTGTTGEVVPMMAVVTLSRLSTYTLAANPLVAISEPFFEG
jgi:hypothetical protein